MRLSKIITLLLFVSALYLTWLFGYVNGHIKQFAQVTPSLAPAKAPYSAEKLEALVNEWRVSQGLQPLTHSDSLCKIALTRLAEVQANWSHNGFDASRFCKQCLLGENLARRYDAAEDVVTGWENSKTHLEQMSYSYTHSCVATQNGYAVQIFGYY